MTQPKVIFLDAMGTLFGLRGTVGEMYGKIAAHHGVNIDPQILDQAFFKSLKSANPLAFPEADSDQISQLEYQWWKAIAKNTFSSPLMNQFANFDAFFQDLYEYFATGVPWYVYEDVWTALIYWQNQGIELGIISNFDSRLYTVLEGLGLKDFFRSITLSSLSGAAKPDSQIFLSALAKHDCTPQDAWHIGDSLQEDYYGAKSAGLNAFFLDRYFSFKSRKPKSPRFHITKSSI